MKSSKVNTEYNNRSKVRNLSALVALLLAAATLFQAGTANSKELNNEMSVMEAELIAEVEQFMMDDEMDLEESLLFEVEEEEKSIVNIFDNDNNLVASGDPANDSDLRKLVNQADYLSELGSQKYYRLSE